MESGTEGDQVVEGAGGEDFDFAFFGVADPPTQIERAGLAVNEPAEAYALHAAVNEEVSNHG